MIKKKYGVYVDIPEEEGQSKAGPPVALMLITSAAVAITAMSVVWFLFFRN